MDAAREKEKNFIFGAERQVRNVCNPPLTPALRLESGGAHSLCRAESHTHIRTAIHTFIPVCVFVHVCMGIHTVMHTCIHTYIQSVSADATATA